MKRDELAVLTTLSGDSVVTRTEAARLRNENLSLHKELEARSAALRSGPDKQSRGASAKKTIGKTGGERTYVVQPGDTLASISRKFYKSPKRWQKILDANRESIRNPGKLKLGQTLIIP
jgi:nucleoid-associated protein YgaU